MFAFGKLKTKWRTAVKEHETKGENIPEISTQSDQKSQFFLRISEEFKNNGIEIQRSENNPVIVTKGNQRVVLASQHWFYAEELCNHFDYYFSSTVPENKDGLEIIDYSKPGWHVMRNTGQRIYYTSWAEDLKSTEDYLDYLYPREGDVVIDVGAYCGLSTLAFSHAVGPSGKVLAFEPDPINFNALQINMKEAGVTNVITNRKALAGSSGTLLFSSEGNMGSMILPPDAELSKVDKGATSKETLRGPAVEVEAMTLERVLEEYSLKKVDIIKLDIEGAEYSVIEACQNLIGKIGARWAIELHADQLTHTPLNVERIRKIFDALDYLTVLQQTDDLAGISIFAFPRKTRR